MSQKQYTCDLCLGQFTSGWTDEAHKEYKSTFGDTPMGTSIVFDDCYRKIMTDAISRFSTFFGEGGQ